MIVFCPGCGNRISAAPSPLDTEGTVTCPKCKSRFATAGVNADASLSEPKRKFRPKKKGGAGIGIAIGALALAVLGGTAAALYYGGVFSKSPTAYSGSSSSAGGPAVWKVFTSAEGRFRVLLPGDPVRTARPKKDIEYKVDNPDLQILVVFADLPEKSDPEKLMVPPNGSKVLSDNESKLGEQKGRDIVADIPGRGVVHMRYVSAGHRLYSVVIAGKGKPVGDTEVKRLFDSFQITG